MVSTDVTNSKKIDDRVIRAVRTSDVMACAVHAASGGLVAFPTETVYGLGCDALNPDAIQAVFDAKERPLTDPLIVHVLSADDAFDLWAATSSTTTITTSIAGDGDGDVPIKLEGRILAALCDEFWPGPLTMVAAAALDKVPSKIMAGTGFVAVRSPRHATARALLKAAAIPMAAPSANKFGHVSPTTADHVWDDLQCEPVWILEDAATANENLSKSMRTSCEVGLESTIAKVEQREMADTNSSKYVVTVLRQGAVSAQDIMSCLDGAGLRLGTDVMVTLNLKQATADHVVNVAPGQTLRHYSPNVPSFLVSVESVQQQRDNDQTSNHVLETAVVLDYAGQLIEWKKFALAYRDLSPSGNSAEAAQVLFDTLRWAEHVKGAVRIFSPEMDESSSDALVLALKDRLTRAASGRVVDSLHDACL